MSFLRNSDPGEIGINLECPAIGGIAVFFGGAGIESFRAGLQDKPLPRLRIGVQPLYPNRKKQNCRIVPPLAGHIRPTSCDKWLSA